MVLINVLPYFLKDIKLYLKSNLPNAFNATVNCPNIKLTIHNDNTQSKMKKKRKLLKKIKF